MNIKISNDRKLKDLQTEFSNFFPYLRIEFYREVHQFGLASDENDRLDPELTVGMIAPLLASVFISVNSCQKVGDFEKRFSDTFGLNVQVFRKSYGKWLQTWATDIWTLEEQNNRGRIMGDKRA